MQPNSFAVAYTPWCVFEAGCDEQEVLLSINSWQAQQHLSLVLAAGVDFGQLFMLLK